MTPSLDDREPLRDKRLLVVFGSYRSKRHIYEHARELGVRLIVVDGPGHWSRECSGPDGLFERHLAVDLAPFETFADRAVAAVRASGLAVDGVGTIDEFAGGFAARIALALGLPFHDVAAADLARDKNRVREACAKAGLPGPRCARIETAADLPAAASAVGFPSVLKPVSGVGSVQTHRVTDEAGLARRHREILDEIAAARVKQARTLSSDQNWFDLMWAGKTALTLESWVEGQKFDVDILLESGEVVYGHATDDLDPCGLRDVRRTAPVVVSESEEKDLIDHAAACVRAIGFRSGAFNVEVKRTADGPRMIEVNGRLGGYSTTDIHRAVWGVDLVEQWLRISLSRPVHTEERPPACFVAESLLPAPRSGTLSRDGSLDPLRSMDGVVMVRPWVFAGERVAGVETGAPDWLGALVVRGATREGALARLDELVASLDFPLLST